MRSLRLLSLGTCSPSWTPQVASLRCKYIAPPCQGICRSRRSIEFRVRREGFRTLLRELRSHSLSGAREGSPQLARSSLRDSSELSSSGYGHHYGGFVLPSLLNVRGRPYVSVAGKKGKKADRDVLLKEREEDLVEEEHEHGHEDEEKAKGKKKLKGKKKHDAVDNVNGNAGIGEAEAQLKQKKKKLKELFGKSDDVADRSDEVEENEQLEGSESALNGAVIEQNSGTKKEEKEKKKLKSKAKDEDCDDGDSGKEEENVEAHLKQKEKKKHKGKAKTEDGSDEVSIKGDGSISDFEGPEEGEEMESFENTEASANVMEVAIAEEIDEHLDDDDFWEDDFEPEAEVDDGGDGGGIVLGDAPWANIALQSAEEVVTEFKGELALFAFKASKENSLIRIRLDKFSDKYGSPTMDEIENFSSLYSKRLNQAEEAGTIPNDISLEVSSPGAERVARIPQDLKRFKELPMYVRYLEKTSNDDEEVPEKDGILELESIDTEGGTVTWKLANVRINRDLAGKGRGLNRKQRDWRAQLPFEALQLVRLYIDV